jgi:two-component system phosphate regulon sensor histidine kinase PhoR
MPKRTATSLHGLTLAVLLPLGVLIVLALQGTRSQAKAAWDAKQLESERAVEGIADYLAKEFTRKTSSFKRFADPPLPGSSSPLDAILDGDDIAALIKLRDSPDAGLSPAGLPRRVLAGLRLIDLDPASLERTTRERWQLAQLVTEDCPSLLTETALKRIGTTSAPGARPWEKVPEVMRLLRHHPQGGWIQEQDRFWWIEPGQEEIKFLDPETIHWAVHEKYPQVAAPTGFGIRISTARSLPRSPDTPDLFAVAPIAFGEGLRAEVFLRNADQVTSGIRRQQVWTFSLLGLASAVSLGGLFFIHRTLRRERQLNDMKSQFVASVSHELRAPVASIRLMADALEAEKVTSETAKEFHRLIAREGARLSTLVGNVLDHARIEQGKRVWKMEPCDLESLVADTLRVMEPLANEKSIELRSALSPLEAAVDAGAIQQALVNLLDNAIKFSPAGSTVETSLSNDEERRTWRIAVRDEGPGIAKAEQARIFERFYRPGDELRRETQGTGIGLSLVKAIAEAHGGSVSVDSEPGQGSRFTLTFPLVLPLITDH